MDSWIYFNSKPSQPDTGGAVLQPPQSLVEDTGGALIGEAVVTTPVITEPSPVIESPVEQPGEQSSEQVVPPEVTVPAEDPPPGDLNAASSEELMELLEEVPEEELVELLGEENLTDLLDTSVEEESGDS
jgi:hypothetical protein